MSKINAFSKNLNESEIKSDNYSSSEDIRLHVDSDSDRNEEKQSSPRKRCDSESSNASADTIQSQPYDFDLDKTIHNIVKRENITEDAVRKILNKLVKNYHVLALVKLKEEELLKMEGNNNNTEERVAPITRRKAKELNQDPLPLKPVKPSLTTSSEVVELINSELHSDEEDEEYQPSDDETNTTISDIDSLPRTPQSVNAINDLEHDISPMKKIDYTPDGIFKIPQKIENNEPKIITEDEIIAQRTRSKVCLQSTPIEAIESTFIPPDITTDMYDFDCDIDNNWKDFLKEFQMPLNTNENDDDEADPEYIADAAAEKENLDEEDIRDPKISKKEVNDLIKAICEYVFHDSNDNTTEVEQVPSQLNTPKPKLSPRMRRLNSSQKSIEKSGQDESYFNPDIISTPLVIKSEPQTIIKSESNCTTITNMTEQNTMIVSSTELMNEQQNNSTTFVNDSQNNSNQTSVNLTASGMFQFPGVVPYLVQVPSSNPNEIQFYSQIPQQVISTTPVFVPISQNTNGLSGIKECNLTDDIKKEKITRSALLLEKRFGYLRNVKPNEYIFPASAVGFTYEQRDLLDHQLRMHVQLIAQNFVQTYAHPKFYIHANTFLNYLKELENKKKKSIHKDRSVFNIWNLDLAIEFCNEWVSDLAVDNYSSKKYLEQLNIGLIKSSKNRYTSNPIPRKLQYKIMSSKAFMYPQLLPAIQYKYPHVSSSCVFLPEEEFLIAMGMEKYYEELMPYKSKRSSKVALYNVCRKISGNLCVCRTTLNIKKLITLRKTSKVPINPIQYYTIHKKAPPIRFSIKDTIDLNNVKAPKDYAPGTMSNKIWDKLVHSKDRLGRIHNQKLVEQGKSIEYFPSDEEDNGLPMIDKKVTLNKLVNKEENENAAVVKLVLKTINEKENKCKQNPYENNCDQLKILPKSHNSSASPKQSSPIQQDFVFKIPPSGSESCRTSDEVCDSSDDISSVTLYSSKSLCSCCTHSSPSGYTSQDIVPLKGQKLVTDYFKTEYSNGKFTKENFCNTFSKILSNFRINYLIKNNVEIKINSFLILYHIFNHIKLFDIYVNLLIDIKMNPNFKIILNNNENVNEGLSAKPIFNRNLIFDEKEEKEKDRLFAMNFYEKVKETFTEENKKDFETFHKILIDFDFENDTVPELYNKMEKLFYPRYPELAELFLTFLLPENAAQIGKFFEHFLMTNMNNFINKLNLYYSRQPQQIRKIYACLNELSEEKNLTIETIKSRILPLLKGNQILIDWFLQLFKSSGSPDSTITKSYETININKSIDEMNKNLDGYEKIPTCDIFPDDNEIQNCRLKFLQGRIFYGNRILLPVKLSFLACDLLPSKNTSLDPALLKVDENEEIVKCVHHNDLKNLCNLSCEKNEFENNENHISVSRRSTSSTSSDYDFVIDLCDDDTLKMHSNRLNPNLTRNIYDNENKTNSIKNSPKSSCVKKLNSPNTKNLKKSPNYSRNSNSNKKRMEVNVNSKAINTSRKISKMISQDINISRDEDRPLNEILKIARKRRNAVLCDDSGGESSDRVHVSSIRKRVRRRTRNSKEFTNKTSPLNEKCNKLVKSSKSDNKESIDDNKMNESSSSKSSNITEENTKKNVWTRDEDKIILEAINDGCIASKDLVTKVIDKLENRSIEEIVERYNFLLDVLKQFQIK